MIVAISTATANYDHCRVCLSIPSEPTAVSHSKNIPAVCVHASENLPAISVHAGKNLPAISLHAGKNLPTISVHAGENLTAISLHAQNIHRYALRYLTVTIHKHYSEVK